MVRIFPRFSRVYLSVFSPDAGKSGKNAHQNNFKYGLFLRSENGSSGRAILVLGKTDCGKTTFV